MKQSICIVAVIIVLLTTTLVSAQSEVPVSIVEKSNQYIISKVGQDFFDQYITFSANQSKYYPPNEICIQNPGSCSAFLQRSHYLMVYSFKMPEKPFIDELIDFAVDADGNIITERDVFGVPDCVQKPKECDFPIDEEQVIQIAKKAGLEAGTADWKTSFNWYAGDMKTYIWSVQNTLAGTEYRGNGQSVVIDANSGEVKGIFGW